MAVSLYDLSVASYLQTLGGVARVLEKGATYAKENGIDAAELVTTSLHPDMKPLHFQIVSVYHHSLGAIRGIRNGLFTPPPDMNLDYAGLQGLVEEAVSELQGISRGDMDALENRALQFKAGSFELPFTGGNFILSFSLPNFYFHATTAYDILRMVNVPLGKLDYLGNMRVGG